MALMKYQELRDALTISKHNLDEELIRQPELYMHVAEHAVSAGKELTAYYEAVKQTDAEVAQKLREEALESGAKVTEASLTQSVLLSKEHNRAVADHVLAREASDLLNELKEAYRQRGYMLRELCNLFVAGYYAQDSVKAPEHKIREKQSAEGRQAIARKRRSLQEEREKD